MDIKIKKGVQTQKKIPSRTEHVKACRLLCDNLTRLALSKC